MMASAAISVVTGCQVNGWVDAWRRSRKVLQTWTDAPGAGVSAVGASAAQAGIRFRMVRPAAVTEAALRNPRRELFVMCAVSFSSPVDVTRVPTNANTL